MVLGLAQRGDCRQDAVLTHSQVHQWHSHLKQTLLLKDQSILLPISNISVNELPVSESWLNNETLNSELPNSDIVQLFVHLTQSIHLQLG